MRGPDPGPTTCGAIRPPESSTVAGNDEREFQLLAQPELRQVLRARSALIAVLCLLLVYPTYVAAAVLFGVLTNQSTFWAFAFVNESFPNKASNSFGASVLAGIAIFLAFGLRRLLRWPVSRLVVFARGVRLVDARGSRVEYDLSLRNPDLVLYRVPVTFPPSPWGSHWGGTRVVAGIGGGTCQFDDEVLECLSAMSERVGAHVERTPRRALEGVVEEIRITAGRL